jgi:hypothetical protein
MLDTISTGTCYYRKDELKPAAVDVFVVGVFSQTVVLENAMSDVRDTFELSVVNGNPSGVALTTQDADRYCDELECPAHATTIVMDDLLEVSILR